MLCPYLLQKVHYCLDDGLLLKFGFFSEIFEVSMIFSDKSVLNMICLCSSGLNIIDIL